MILNAVNAKSLGYREEVFEATCLQSDGMPARWFVSGKVKTWKRSPDRVTIPVKHGLYVHRYITEKNISVFYTNRDEAMMFRPMKVQDEGAKAVVHAVDELPICETDDALEILLKCKASESTATVFFIKYDGKLLGYFDKESKIFYYTNAETEKGSAFEL